MRTRTVLAISFLASTIGGAPLTAQERPQTEIANWSAPPFWEPAPYSDSSTVSAGRTLVAQGAISSPMPFTPVTPCRLADTRGNGFTGGYGPPSISANTTRTFIIVGQCSIPGSAVAVSFNFGALNITANGDMRVYPAGGMVPLVSTLNYNAAIRNISNAAVVPLGSGGGITVQADAVDIDLIIDVNGYYGGGVGNSNTFLGSDAGNFTMTGGYNSAIGAGAFSNNTTGSSNVAFGYAALGGNTTGSNNTAIGNVTLFFTTSGGANTAVGTGALQNNVGGSSNTAVGNAALAFTTGGSNIGLGSIAGSSLTTGSFNIDIGNAGSTGDSGIIRIGTAGNQTATFVAGITGTAVSGTAVVVSSSGQLGAAPSSRRFKDAIRDIGGESDGLLSLRPVAFKYTREIDPAGLVQYGLIAEEVAEVYPDLVGNGRDDRPLTVRYDLVNALLLNEVQKEHRIRAEQGRTIERLRETVQELKARLAKLEERVPSGRPE